MCPRQPRTRPWSHINKPRGKLDRTVNIPKGTRNVQVHLRAHVAAAYGRRLAFVGFIIALYVLSVVYVFIDARRRGASAYVAWGIIALIPFVGLIAYLVLRPHSYASDREEQELDMALRERQLAQYGTCPQCGAPIEKDFVVCPVCDTQVRNVCPSCHRPLDAHWKVCPYCRTRIQ